MAVARGGRPKPQRHHLCIALGGGSAQRRGATRGG